MEFIVNYKRVEEVRNTESTTKMIKRHMIDRGRDDFVNYLSEILGISKQWASAKLSGKTSFTDRELAALDAELDFDEAELKKSLRSC